MDYSECTDQNTTAAPIFKSPEATLAPVIVSTTPLLPRTSQNRLNSSLSKNVKLGDKFGVGEGNAEKDET